MADELNQSTPSVTAEEQMYTKAEVEEITKQRLKNLQAQNEKERQEKEELRKQLDGATRHLPQNGTPDVDWEKIIDQEVDKRANEKAEPLAKKIAEQKKDEEKIEKFGMEFNEATKQDSELLELSQKGNRLPENAILEIAKMDYIPNKIAVLKDLLKDKANADILLSSSSPAEFKKNIKEISERLSKIAPGPSKYQSADKLSPSVSGAPDDEIDFVARARKKGM